MGAARCGSTHGAAARRIGAGGKTEEFSDRTGCVRPQGDVLQVVGMHLEALFEHSFGGHQLERVQLLECFDRLRRGDLREQRRVLAGPRVDLLDGHPANV